MGDHENRGMFGTVEMKILLEDKVTIVNWVRSNQLYEDQFELKCRGGRLQTDILHLITFCRFKMKSNQLFSSFIEFKSALKKYEKKSCANFAIHHSKKLSLRQEPSLGLRDKCVYSYVYFQCKMGGVFRQRAKVRYTKSFKKKCKSLINLKYDSARKMLRVTRIKEKHNHARSKSLFSCMPKQRILSKKEKGEVNYIIGLRPDFRTLQQRLGEKRIVPPTLKDLHNIKQRYTKAAEVNVLQSVIDELTRFRSNIVKMFVDNNNELQGIFFQDERMKVYFDRYPELLIIDATYKLNNRRMPLLIMMIVDGTGQSQIVSLFVIKTESSSVFDKMFHYFKSENSNAKSIEVIMADKSFAERKALRKAFPNAQLQICIFHVAQIFQREITCAKRNISKDQRTEALKILNGMIFADSEEKYDQLHIQLLSMNSEKLTAYFSKQWHSCKEQWASAFTNNHFNMLNRTNNRVESCNQKLKAAITRNGTAPTFISELMKCVSSFSFEKDFRTLTSLMRTAGNTYPTDSAEYKYRALLTEFAFGKLLGELEKIESFDAHIGKDLLTFKLNNTDQMSKICRLDECECRFFQTMHLPCRHIFKLLSSRKKHLYAKALCHKRWHKSYLPFESMSLGIEKNRSMSEKDKFVKARAILNDICEILSQKPKSLFETYIEKFAAVRYCIQNNECFSVEVIEQMVTSKYSSF